MEVMVVVQSGTLHHALRVRLKRRVSTRRGGDYSEVPQAIQEKSHPSPSNCVTPSSCMLLSEQGFGFQKAYVVECRVFASYFQSDEVQNEAEVRGSTPVSANDWGKNTAAVAVLIKFALNWASLIFLRAMQLKVERTRSRTRTRTRTRTNTIPNDTEANAAGRSVRACVARKSKS